MLTKLDKAECRQLLEKKNVGHMGCVLASGEPYVVPVNYLFSGDNIHLHSKPGEKISALKINPLVCLQVDDVEADGLIWQSVIAFGNYKEIPKSDEYDRILNKFLTEFPNFTPVEADVEPESRAGRIIVFSIEISRITGVSESL